MKTPLPIDAHLGAITAHLKTHPNLVLVAEPGAGKTTRLPPALLTMAGKKVLVLEPRRVAAVAAADRIASENGWTLGREVGYRVRFESQASASTRLIFMTEALLARQLLQDPELQDVDIVVLDEFHERSTHVDLALGLLRELQELGRDIKIVVMSATLESQKISSYLGDAPIVQVPGSLHDLEIHNLDKNLRPVLDPGFFSTLSLKIKEAAAATAGDVLVFLPGVGEIEHTRERLEPWARDARVELAILHGSLSLEDQRRALRRSENQRVILATNVAESSLTVDGVTCVVDSGLMKTLKQDLTTGFSRLELGRISLSSAKQRAGRAARQAPGQCFRLWTVFDENTMKNDDVPEILRSDLSESLIFLAASGVTNFENFAWFEKPQTRAILAATRELKALGALDAGGAITPLGRQMAELPLAPRWARFLIACAGASPGPEVAAMMQERDFLKPGVAERYIGDGLENDLLLRAEILRDFSTSRRDHDGEIKRSIAKNILATAEQLKRLLKTSGKLASPPRQSSSLDAGALDVLALQTFTAFLCRRRPKSEKGLMVGGRGVRLADESVVKESEFFLALQGVDTDTQNETRVSLAWGLDSETVLKELAAEIDTREELAFDAEKGQLFLKRARYFRDLPLEEPRLLPAPAEQSSEKLADVLASDLEYVRRQNEDFAHWLDRWAMFAKTLSPDSELTPVQIREALQMAAMGERKIETLVKKNLTVFLENVVPSDKLAAFKRHAPHFFEAPTGSKFKIHYPPERPPYVEVRLQELFGVKESPKLLGEKMPLQFHLLGPNYRPVQVTSDLASFWKNTYAEVRKELRSRYPKHSWPENPLEAPAVRRGRSVKA